MLQGVAWIGMIHEYSQEVPLMEAVSMTLSGKYPCAMCKAIAERKQSEKDKAVAVEKYEKKFLSTGAAVAGVNLMPSPIDYLDYRNSLQSRSETPPTPPPRQA